jgi:outer membrane lipoprotein-sorting protein
MKKIVFLTFLICLGVNAQMKIEKLKLEMVAKTLHNKKSIVIKSDVYYRVTGGLMVTKSSYPSEQITITNNNGEFKHYDFKTNTATVTQGLDLSSENSIFYNFLLGNINDMGLTKLGFKIKSTKPSAAGEKKMIVTIWTNENNPEVGKVELVHENSLPIFICFYDKNNKPLQKSFYSNYQYIGNLKMPLTITEFEYVGLNDSVVSKKTYSNPKLNSDVEDTYFSFKIPSNAKFISPTSKN